MNAQTTERERPEVAKRGIPTFVVVDDDSDTREALSTLLQLEGHKVLRAADGVEGLCLISELEASPCIVLLDMMMPEMSGAEVMVILREAEQLPELPVIVISASTPCASEVAGARICLHKPLDIEVTLTVVRRLCSSFE